MVPLRKSPLGSSGSWFPNNPAVAICKILSFEV